jgi:L-lactate utilization protein LutB
LKGSTAPQYFRVPYTIARSNDEAEAYIDKVTASQGTIVERKMSINYNIFIEEYLKPEGLWL